MCALLPAVDGLPGVGDCDLDAFLTRMLGEATWMFWLGMVAGAFVFTTTPWLTVYVPLPSFLLPAGLLDRHAARIVTTRLYFLRQSVFLLKMGACLCWGADPRVRARFLLPALQPDPGTWRS